MFPLRTATSKARALQDQYYDVQWSVDGGYCSSAKKSIQNM